MRLAHTAGDQLRVLGTEVDDQDEVVLGAHVAPRRSVTETGTQRPMPTPWARCSDLPSVCSDGATITSAFWNSFSVS